MDPRLREDDAESASLGVLCESFLSRTVERVYSRGASVDPPAACEACKSLKLLQCARMRHATCSLCMQSRGAYVGAECEAGRESGDGTARGEPLKEKTKAQERAAGALRWARWEGWKG